jgi:hypothetical protein
MKGVTMAEKFYTIELRQFEVPGANARHYFWVLKDEANKVVGEMHGHPADWKTGKQLGLSLGGDRLKFFRHREPREYSKSAKLPYVIAYFGPAEEALARWRQGVRRGEVINRDKISYYPASRNSNTANQYIGRAMGFRVAPIIDPRPDVQGASPMPVALGSDLGEHVSYTPMSPYEDTLEEVGGYGIKPGNAPEWPTSEWP